MIGAAYICSICVLVLSGSKRVEACEDEAEKWPTELSGSPWLIV